MLSGNSLFRRSHSKALTKNNSSLRFSPQRIRGIVYIPITLKALRGPVESFVRAPLEILGNKKLRPWANPCQASGREKFRSDVCFVEPDARHKGTASRKSTRRCISESRQFASNRPARLKPARARSTPR